MCVTIFFIFDSLQYEDPVHLHSSIPVTGSAKAVQFFRVCKASLNFFLSKLIKYFSRSDLILPFPCAPPIHVVLQLLLYFLSMYIGIL